MPTKSIHILNKFALLAGTAGLALTIALGGHSMAQSHSGSGGSGHDSGTSHESGAGHDSGSSHEGGSGGKKMRKGATGERGGGRGGSLRDVFKQMEIEEALEESRGQRRGQSDQGQRGGQAAADKGQQGGQKPSSHGSAEAEADDGTSSKPSWAGNPEGGGGGKTDKGDLYGDLYVVTRDNNGIPELAPPKDEAGVVIPGAEDQLQVWYTDANGELTCCVPYTVVDGEYELVEGYDVQEAEFSRVSVVRSPDRVLNSQYLEFIKLLDAADSVTIDQTDRIILNDEDADGNIVDTSSIDSPLIYLTLYEATVTTGTLPDAVERNGDIYVPTTDLLAKLPAELSALADGIYTTADRDLSAIFLAAAMDKAGTATADMIVYLNAQLDVVTDANQVPGNEDYVMYSDFTYDRVATYADDPNTTEIENAIVVQIEDPNNPGTWVTQTVNILDQVFDGEAATATTGIDGYTQAVDDARAVIDYVHTYAPPETN